MRQQRFWFGMAMATLPAALLLLAACPGVRSIRSGPVEGTVRIHGRPLTQATLVFVPEDDRHGQWAAARCDEGGHFVLSRQWSREAPLEESGFRICIIPDDRPSAPGVAFELPRRLSDPRTTPLEVHLNSQPAQLNIAL